MMDDDARKIFDAIMEAAKGMPDDKVMVAAVRAAKQVVKRFAPTGAVSDCLRGSAAIFTHGNR